MQRRTTPFGQFKTSLGIGALVIAACLLGGVVKAAEPIFAISASNEELKGTARLVFELTQPVDPAAFVLNDPRRIIIDLPEVNFQFDPQQFRNAKSPLSSKTGKQGRGNLGGQPQSAPVHLVQAFRYGLLGPGRSRIVIDLSGPAKILRAICEPVGRGPASRLIIELAQSDAISFQAMADNGAKPQPLQRQFSAAAKSSADSVKPLIVIDPGHGGIDAGASAGAAVVEKAVVFDFAKTLAQKLEATGTYRVLLTRTDDRFVSLGERVQIARDNHAALFISVHADTLHAAAGVQGATIYTLAEKASDAEAARTADKENQSDSVAGVVGPDDSGGVADILFELTRRETRAYSHLFARSLVGLWQSSGRLNKNPQRAAGFKVLRAPDVPSVLIELGYLSSLLDVADLTSPEWRNKTADNIATAVGQFFASRVNTELEGAGSLPVLSDASASVQRISTQK